MATNPFTANTTVAEDRARRRLRDSITRITSRYVMERVGMRYITYFTPMADSNHKLQQLWHTVGQNNAGEFVSVVTWEDVPECAPRQFHEQDIYRQLPDSVIEDELGLEDGSDAETETSRRRIRVR